MPENTKRILIVGGVAGGASCAARARRLCERCEIILFDRGPFVSFANCGLPYYVGDVIAEESKLLVATPELFKKRFNIEVRTQTEVTAIDPVRRTIEFEELETGRTGTETYDALVLAPGARAVRPPIEGIDLPGIFVVRTIPDTRKIREAVEGATSAVVVGAGFIGLEMAENLARRGLEVTLIELADQVLPPIDREMARFVERHLRANGVRLRLASGVEAFERGTDGRLLVRSGGGDRMATDLAILAIGVRPETTLAEQAGLALGARGGIRVDEHMRTSDEHIWAVGDAVEVTDVVTGTVGPLPLAGPANRQGRIAAANVLRTLGMCRSPAGEATFRGVQATAVCGVFGLTVAMTGASEKSLERAGITAYEKVYLHPGSHAGYFPGAKPIHMKLLFSTEDGRVLGAQAVGEEGAERRIDVIAMAIQMGATVFDLEEAELCYAPQFGAAKDPVNIAGMIAANCMRGDLALARWEDLERTDALILDVRTEAEYERGHIPGSANIPIEQLRARLDELPTDREIWLVCGVGQRAYYATRALIQRGLSARVLPGGMQTYEVFS